MKKRIMSLACSAAVVASCLVAAVPASADVVSPEHSEVSDSLVEAAMPEFLASGMVTSRDVTASGDRVTTMTLGHGVQFELVQPSTESSERIQGGKDSKGIWVQFNTVDQNLILSGGAWMMAAGICAAFGLVSGGAACVIVGAVTTAAVTAISANGGSCAHGKQLRVWVAGGSKPKCV